MHIPDGFIDAPTSIAAGVLAVGGLTYCVRRASVELDDKLAPMAGLVAAFIFAVQMLNFPVALGTSGHLLGGCLAALLVGPAAGAMCVTVVLMVQMLFADGGISALGLNVTNMGLVTAFVGYAVFLALRKVLGDTDKAIALAAGIAAAVSVPVAALAFSLEFWVGGAADLPVGGVVTAMLGTHVLIGIGEGIITALTIAAVLRSRPDLVFAVRDRTSRLEIRTRASA